MTYLSSFEDYDSSPAAISFQRRVNAFLSGHGLNYFRIDEIPGDASLRRYYRVISSNGRSFILMDAFEELSTVKPFIYVCDLLLEHGFSVPRIYHKDLNNGLLLLEDFGNNLFTRFFASNPKHELDTYFLAIDVLLDLHKVSTDGLNLPVQSHMLFNAGLSKFVQNYLQNKISNVHIKSAEADLHHVFNDLYKSTNAFKQVIVLRDFHADNLFYLPNRDGVRSIGIIDFQDAIIGSPAYDLMSLLHDVRHNVSAAIEAACMDKYLDAAECEDKEGFKHMYDILSLQRSLRILGIFYRKGCIESQTKYIEYIPNVIRYIKLGLKNPAFDNINKWFARYDCRI